jgi:NAD(P)-dependent dehydrogenase (short-subunit alcohol dehydrogenase family)
VTRRRSYRGAAVLVTGGGSGIGLALGQQLATAGAQVTLADIDHDAASAAAERINASGEHPAATGCGLDVRDLEAFRVVVDSIVETAGRIDVLVNNAGISMGGPTHELTSAHWDRIIDVNLKGVVNGVLAAYPRMVEQGDGQIVNTASGAGLVPPPFVVAYATTKHAVAGLSTGLRPEAARHGVSISALCPGAVDTPILDQLPDDDLPTGETPAVTARAYLGVLGFTPMPAERFAERAVRAMARNKALIVEPRETRLLWRLNRASPRLGELVTRRIAGKVDRELLSGSPPPRS